MFNNLESNQKRLFPIIFGVLVLLFVVGGGGYYLGTQRNQNSRDYSDLSINQPSPASSISPANTTIAPTVSPTDYEDAPSPLNYKAIPEQIIPELPEKSPDGKEVIPETMINDKYLIYCTYVTDRGAGPQYVYWLYDRVTKTSTSFNDLIKQNEDFTEKFGTTFGEPDGLFFSYVWRWVGENPVFSVADGWAIVDEYWVYDLEKESFYYLPRRD